MSRKFDFNGTHIPPPYMDRSFNGTENMIARKSVQEAPDVSMYDYNNVGNFECMTSFDMMGVDQNSTFLTDAPKGTNIGSNALLNLCAAPVQGNNPSSRLYMAARAIDVAAMMQARAEGGNLNYQVRTPLLNDAWICVLSDQGTMLCDILNTLVNEGVNYPADHPITNMFGTTTLWDKIHDKEFHIPEKIRSDAIKLLSMYHFDKGTPAATTGSGSAPF